MTAEEIFEQRTGKDGTDWIAMAEEAVRAYLRYDAEESLARFAFAVADIAVTYYQRDEALQTAFTPGVKSESFTEGKVSVKQDYLTSAEMSAQYDTKVQTALAGLKRFRRAHVPEVNDADEG